MTYRFNDINCWCISNNSQPLYGEEVDRITAVVPSQRQLDFLKLEYYNFIHFGINTFYSREWGDGNENIRRFNPRSLDTDQWCRVLKQTGSRGIILTAKHHDGFCLFGTAYTDHNVTNTPFAKEILALLSCSCKKFGLKLGVYLSPWDRHEKTYGSEAYNDFFVSQLRELCTNYGEIFAFWFDGACGEGKNGKKQTYDWERYYSVIRELQPQAVISVCGPDVRWIGNEGGRVRKSEWSVIPDKSIDNNLIMENSQQNTNQQKMMETLCDTDEDLGSRERLSRYNKLVFSPAEADVSINYGWFYNSNLFSYSRKQRRAKYLAQVYFDSVGGNASMLLNVPVDKNGLIGKREQKCLREFTRLINAPFEKPVKAPCFFFAEKQEITRSCEDNYFLFGERDRCIVCRFDEKKQISTVVLREDLTFSQRVELFGLYKREDNGLYSLIFSGTVIGNKKIVRLEESVFTDEILIVPAQSRGKPVLCDISFYS